MKTNQSTKNGLHNKLALDGRILMEQTAENQPATIDGASLKPQPTPSTIHLKTPDDVRLEMAKVYRDMRRGDIDMSDGTKLIYALSQINKAIEMALIEVRITSQEKTIIATDVSLKTDWAALKQRMANLKNA